MINRECGREYLREFSQMALAKLAQYGGRGITQRGAQSLQREWLREGW